MSILPKAVEKLIESFEKLPGIGPKTASRLTFYLLHVPQGYLDQFSDAIKTLKALTVFCSQCFNIGEEDPCKICMDSNRDTTIICVVEQPIEIISFEKTGRFKGLYHVLHGAINPLNSIGPDEIHIAELLTRLKSGRIKEVILATNPNMEGEATAMYIKREILNLKTSRHSGIHDAVDSHSSQTASGQISNLEIRITRLAHGLPVGGDIEYADEMTLSRAMEGRGEY